MKGRTTIYKPMPDGTKFCPKCETVKALDDFYSETYKNGNIYFKKLCKRCSTENNAIASRNRPKEVRDRYLKNWVERNPNGPLEAQRKYLKKTNYRKAKKFLASAKGQLSIVKMNSRRRSRKAGALTENSHLVSGEWFLGKQKEQGFRCYYCWSMPMKMSLEHVVPISRGGKHECSNIVAVCKSCNSSKGNKLLSEWHQPQLAIPIYGLDLASA